MRPLSHAQRVNFGTPAIAPRPKELYQSECQNCGQFWPDDHLEPVQHPARRIEPGEPWPTGECPDCGALCQPVDEPVYAPA